MLSQLRRRFALLSILDGNCEGLQWSQCCNFILARVKIPQRLFLHPLYTLFNFFIGLKSDLCLRLHLTYAYCSDLNNVTLTGEYSSINFLLYTNQSKQKHCQRHNGPEGWVHLTKVTSWGHITSSSLIRVLKIKSTTWYTSRKATKWASQSVSRVMLKPLPSSRQKTMFLHSSKGGAAHDDKKSPFYMQNREFNSLYQL